MRKIARKADPVPYAISIHRGENGAKPASVDSSPSLDDRRDS
jgi:hypothetical protein